MSDLEQDKINFKELQKIELITKVTGGSILGWVLGVVGSVLIEQNKYNKNSVEVIENIALGGSIGAGLGALVSYLNANIITIQPVTWYNYLISN